MILTYSQADSCLTEIGADVKSEGLAIPANKHIGQ